MLSSLIAAEQFIVGTALFSIAASAAALTYYAGQSLLARGYLDENKLLLAGIKGLAAVVGIDLSAKIYFFTSFLMISPYRSAIYDPRSSLPGFTQFIALGEYVVFFVALNFPALLLIWLCWAVRQMSEKSDAGSETHDGR